MQPIVPSKILRFLLIFVSVVCVLSLVADLVYYYLISSGKIHLNDPFSAGKMVNRVRQLFSVDHEASIPTWYSSIALFVCTAILFVISSIKKRDGEKFANHWMVLSGIFLVLSVDEIISAHEMPTRPMIKLFNLSGFLYFGWVFPVGILVLIFVLSYLKFLIHLPTRIRTLFILSGLIFVGGAMGVELISGWLVYINGGLSDDSSWLTVPYIVTVTVEEWMEMTSVVVFMYALLLALGQALQGKDLAIRIAADP